MAGKRQYVGEFDVPIGLANTRRHDVLVSDFYNSRVQRFAPDGQRRASYPVLPNPGGLAIDGDGNSHPLP
ncbi:MAG: hypothetical protein H6822_33825 [Planctomycetaceae bacterium]|nr:hypothetical protein [Planctomycetales bacterium]MCB9927167.1 hypothetical protein [Planctomycetaceae bacterium]